MFTTVIKKAKSCSIASAQFLSTSIIFCTLAITAPVDAVAEKSYIPDTRQNRNLIKQIVMDISRKAEYLDDRTNHGKRDYGVDLRDYNWIGDCEDFALAFQAALRDKFPDYATSFKVMRVDSYNFRTAKDGAHAVLFIYTDKRAYVAEGPGYYPNGQKIINYPIWLRASQYVNEKRVYGEMLYTSPEEYILVSEYTPYVRRN